MWALYSILILTLLVCSLSAFSTRFTETIDISSVRLSADARFALVNVMRPAVRCALARAVVERLNCE
jgi:hypothetical protein